MDWNVTLYRKFEKERTQPAQDLANAIEGDAPKYILDVGCGPGNSTAVLKKRFPDAQITGADNSDDMLQTAAKNHPDLQFIKIDAQKDLNRLSRKYDVVFSNACIQWIPDHEKLLRDMINLLNEGGTLAVQVPQQQHRVIDNVAKKWSDKILEPRRLYTLQAEEYFNILAQYTKTVRLWQTDYFHIMPSHQSIVDWYKGTALRPYLNQLSPQDRELFEKDVLLQTQKIYTPQPSGVILFKFPRLFFTAQKSPS